MPPFYDALIVGAGPAGCAAAFDLARAGRRVLLLDKRSFPRHKACACGLTRKTLKALRYSVEPVIERECRDVVLQEAGPAFLGGRRTADKSCEVRVHLRNPFCAMAVRERFDAFCLAQTLAEGAVGGRPELRKIEGIVALRELPTHIELDIALPDGVVETLHAPVLIGADGSNGQTRRLSAGLIPPSSASSALSAEEVRNLSEKSTSAPDLSQTPGANALQATAAHLPPEPAWYARGFALEATVPYSALPASLPAGDAPLDLIFDFAPVSGGYGWLFPKGDHINIGVGGFVPQVPAPQTAPQTPAPQTLAPQTPAPHATAQPSAEAPASDTPASGIPGMQYDSVTRALLADYTRTKLGVDLAALTALPGVHVTGQYLGLGGHAYTPRGRVLLTGDAAGLVDPLTGEGIHSALTSGQAAAAAILEGTADALALADAYTRHLRPLRDTLTFSARAARSFYREPERGFKVMRTPLLRNLVLKTYADGLPTTKLLTSLIRRVA